MSRIFIKNSNLFLEKLDNNVDENPEIFPATLSQYFMIKVDGNKVTKCDHLDEPVNGDGYWRLYSGSKRFTTTKSYYSPEERRAILGFLKYWKDTSRPQQEEYLEIEALLHATGDETLINEFYGICDRWSTYLTFLYNIDAEKKLEEYNIVPFSSSYTVDNQEYTITDLIDDLVKDHSSILVDSELLGEYTKISRGVIDTESSLEVDYESWNPIVKKTSHRSRANLSITYSVPVSIEVPENTFTTPGRRNLTSLRSTCIICDGLLWSPKIAVKVNSKELQIILASSPAFIDNILSTEEFILDLTVLPISHFDLDHKRHLSGTEIQILSTELELQYFKTKEYMLRNSLTTVPDKIKQDKKIQTEEEKYLASLGIYGTTYIPKQIKTEKIKDECVTKNLYVNAYLDFGKKSEWSDAIKRYINTGLTSSPRIGIVSYLSMAPKDKTLDEWRELIKEHTKKLDDLKKQKNDLVFSVLLQKDLTLMGGRTTVKVMEFSVTLDLIEETIYI